ncbi:cupredoxin domain-containing protein [Sphaerobacter thermophilus]|uniref:EfeO-type cupredoxin-like domain-containing protein n=1 Tax=Sphaerobacter thermophilus (strain ATCC 49802 / DSM 20745 / KCCM 41009 / NCIMB 13125 / S 6022) TaxID=479434 RepID=D1CA20_SPHTD|nr:cupredoxin domain-containing protein [Sphaerobacter thermophilus]ACZ40663.1 hypothetical protein Sthe_3263 [Sphaerobacter thermophilus DSM 20745]
MVIGSRPAARRVLLVVAVLLSALALAACAGGPETMPSDERVTPGPGNTFSITITDDAITPDNLSAAMGPITFEITNNGSRVHNLAVNYNGIHHQSPDIQPGETITWTIAGHTPSPVVFYSSVGNDRASGLEMNVWIATGKADAPFGHGEGH